MVSLSLQELIMIKYIAISPFEVVTPLDFPDKLGVCEYSDCLIPY